ncbi:GGDEF domain-containing protein [Streptomyces anulatus]
MNDTMCHAVGDTVIAAYGSRLTAGAGPRAAVGRLGGDEFALFLELNADRRERRPEQLVRMLHTPVVLDDGRTVDVAASVGAATPDVLGARDLSRLQRAADAALYEGKRSGRPVLATLAHTTLASINGRRAGRPGTTMLGASRMSTAPLPPAGDWIRGISIKQPWATAILTGAFPVKCVCSVSRVQ